MARSCQIKPGDDPSGDARREQLLAEYSAAQDSAQHHELLAWQAQSILWTASMVLLGSTVTTGASPGIVLVLALAGLALLFFPLVWHYRLGRVKKLKYRRCAEIEKGLHGIMTQHTQTQREFASGYMSWVSHVLVFILATAWVIRAVLALCRC